MELKNLEKKLDEKQNLTKKFVDKEVSSGGNSRNLAETKLNQLERIQRGVSNWSGSLGLSLKKHVGRRCKKPSGRGVGIGGGVRCLVFFGRWHTARRQNIMLLCR